jgi:outer membrane lipoprotein-sorting protein
MGLESSKGKETIEEKDYILLEQRFSDDYTVTRYIDTETYLPYRVAAKRYDQKMMETEGGTTFTDYRDIDGITVAFNRVIFEGGEDKISMTVRDVKLNSGLEDSLFKVEKESITDLYCVFL